MPKSTYYKYRNPVITMRDEENKVLKDNIMRIYLDNNKRYGSPKITELLNREIDYTVSIKRVQRLMNTLGIKSIVIKKFNHYSKTSVSDKGVNLLDQDFNTDSINEKWVADITYIYTQSNGWVYLASVEDLHTRNIIGCAISKTMDAGLVIKALDIAFERQRPTPGVLFHSDRGTQYTSEIFTKTLDYYGMVQSLSNKGNPYDNACIESFHSIIKKEYVHHVRFKNFDEAKLGCIDFIEGWYNRNRIHGSIGYQTPHEFELSIRQNL
jgi:transposase InsO family protein